MSLLLAASLGGCADGPRPNVVLVTVDTLRADHLEVLGHSRETAPGLRRLAEEGVLFEHAISQAPWTLPSVASLLTSLYPIQHGAVLADSALPEEAPTLAEVLREEGYGTVGVASHVFVDSRHGLAQGFDVFDESNIKGHDAVTSESLTETALSRLAEVESPFFLWVHYFDPHFSYVRHPEFGFADGYEGALPADMITHGRLDQQTRRAHSRGTTVPDGDLDYVRAVYDEEIAYTDRWIDELRSRIEADRPGEPILWLLTADHGEYFMERGRFFHGKDVYEPLVHVPLIIAGAIDPALHGTSVARSVEIRSVPLTVMRLLGIEDHPFAGESLLELAPGSEPAPAFTQGLYARGTDQRKHAAVHEGWKLIHNLDDDSHELYFLPTDPGERRDLWETGAGSGGGIRAILEARLEKFAALPGLAPSTLEISPEELERLRSLGYIR